MGLFNKPKSEHPTPMERPTVGETVRVEDKIEERIAPPVMPEVNELSQARRALDDFSADLQESAARQQNAIQRISILNDTVARLELELKAFRRLQSENKQLTRNFIDLENKLNQKSSWASELDSKLAELDRRYSETREQLEAAQADLAVSRDHEVTLENRRSELEREVKDLSAKMQSSDGKISQTEQMMERLQERLDAKGAELSGRERQLIELQNSLEEVKERFDVKARHSDAATVELKNLRTEHNELKSRHVEMSGQFDTLKFDHQSQKNVYDDTLKRRDQEAMALKTRIDQLETQIRIKENMATHLDQEFISLRNALVNERDRADVLEQRLRNKTEEMDRTATALSKSKIEFEDLNGKFTATLDDYETLRKMNQLQREKLERYASIGNNGIDGPSILGSDLHSFDAQPVPEESDKVAVLSAAKKSRPKA